MSSDKQIYNFLDAKIVITEDQLRFEAGPVQKLNQFTQRIHLPDSIQLDDVLRCYVTDSTLFTRASLVIEHSSGREEIRCNEGRVHRITSLLGFDGKEDAEKFANQFDDEGENDKLMERL